MDDEILELIDQLVSLTSEENQEFTKAFDPYQSIRSDYQGNRALDFFQKYSTRQLELKRKIKSAIKFNKSVSDFYSNIVQNSKNMPQDFVKVVNDNFWDLLAYPEDEEETQEDDDTNKPFCR